MTATTSELLSLSRLNVQRSRELITQSKRLISDAIILEETCDRVLKAIPDDERNSRNTVDKDAAQVFS